MSKQPFAVCAVCNRQIGRHDQNRFMQARPVRTTPG